MGEMGIHGRRWFLPFLIIGVGGTVLLALMVGSVSIPPGEIGSRFCRVVLGQAAEDATHRIIFQARLPRVLLALGAGAALSLAGLAAQTLFRNPLASPSVIGVSNGAALGAVIGMLVAGHWGVWPVSVVTLLSVAGGLAATLTVFILGQRGRFFGHALLLAGIAMGALCSALTTAALYLAGERLQAIVFWLMGGLWQASWRDVYLMTPVAAGAFAWLFFQSNAMNVALLGERGARDLGLNVRRLKHVLLAIIAICTSIAVSLTGVIAFVGLIVPHVMRLIVGADHRRLLPATALGGAWLLLLADTLARTLASPAEIPVGIFTAMVGAPGFLWLLQRRQNGGGWTA